jgi:hypothetical protein
MKKASPDQEHALGDQPKDGFALFFCNQIHLILKAKPRVFKLEIPKTQVQ